MKSPNKPSLIEDILAILKKDELLSLEDIHSKLKAKDWNIKEQRLIRTLIHLLHQGRVAWHQGTERYKFIRSDLGTEAQIRARKRAIGTLPKPGEQKPKKR